MDQSPTIPYYIFGKETNNYSRLCRLITEVCTDLIRILFSQCIPPYNLALTLKKNKFRLKQKLNEKQTKLIYPNGDEVSSSLTAKDLDISAMIKILRRLNYVRHTRIAACVEIIRNGKNESFSHTTSGRVEDHLFETIWNDLKCAVVELENILIGGDLFQRAVEYLHSWNNDQLEETQHENRSMQGNDIPLKRYNFKRQNEWFLTASFTFII